MAGTTAKQVFQLKVTLTGSRPPIWRRLLVPTDFSLGDLHAVLQVSFGWADEHLHHFVVNGKMYGTPDVGSFGPRVVDEWQTPLQSVARPKSKLLYEYDFGDSWRHDIVVEKVVPAKEGEHYPSCTAGKRAGPLEDSGGVWGYEEKLEILADPEHEEHDDVRDWIPEGFAPEVCDLDEINRQLNAFGAAHAAATRPKPAKRAAKRAPAPALAPAPATTDRAQRLHALDRALIQEMFAFAEGLEEFVPEEDCPVGDDPAMVPLIASWAAYEYALDEGGDTVRARFLRARRRSLDAEAIAWLEAQGRAYVTAWEVTAVAPGESVDLRDLFTGEVRHVTERSASTALRVHDVVCGRVVDHEGLSLFCGLYPIPLDPREGAAFVELMRLELGGRRSSRVAATMLREPDVGTMFLDAWDEICETLRDRPPPVLHNTDGELFVSVRDELALVGDRSALRAALVAMPGAQPGEGIDFDGEEIAVVRDNPPGSPLENTVIGCMTLSASTLVLETNSRERADKLRADVERACKKLVRFSSRSEEDGAAFVARMQAGGGGGGAAANDDDDDGDDSGLAPEEAQAMIRRLKERHYAAWCDLPVPQLGGKTPREVASLPSKQARAGLEVMLKELERMEASGPVGEAFDVRILRRELGLSG
jgi:hypothetical protein